MNRLAEHHCEPCRSGAPRVGEEELPQLVSEVPEWTLQEVDGVRRLVRSFRFANFKQALEFTNRVGALAEDEGHHPLLVTEWGQVTVQWWTHKIGGLHRNDFVMAAKTDALAGREAQRG